MRALRQWINDRLLASGTTMAFDRRTIAEGIARDRARTAAPYDDAVVAQALFLIEILSRLKIRLGLLIMPPPP